MKILESEKYSNSFCFEFFQKSLLFLKTVRFDLNSKKCSLGLKSGSTEIGYLFLCLYLGLWCVIILTVAKRTDNMSVVNITIAGDGSLGIKLVAVAAGAGIQNLNAKVASVKPGGIAAIAGAFAGALVKAVEGQSVEGLRYAEVLSRIKIASGRRPFQMSLLDPSKMEEGNPPPQAAGVLEQIEAPPHPMSAKHPAPPVEHPEKATAKEPESSKPSPSVPTNEEHKAMLAKLEEYETKQTRLEKELESKSLVCTGLKDSVEKQKSECDSLQAQVDQYKSDQEKSAAELDQCKSARKGVEEELEACRSDMTNLTVEADAQKAENLSLNEKLKDLEGIVKSKEVELKNATEDRSVDEAAKELGQCQLKIQELEAANKKLSDQRSAEAQELQLLKMQLENSVEASTELGKKHAKEKRALVAHANELEKRLEMENSQSADSSKKQLDQVKEMRHQIEILASEKAALTKQLEEIPVLQEKIKTSNKEADAKLQNEKQALVAHAKKLEQQLESAKKLAEEAAAGANSKLAILEERTKSLEGQNKILADELGETNKNSMAMASKALQHKQQLAAKVASDLKNLESTNKAKGALEVELRNMTQEKELLKEELGKVKGKYYAALNFEMENSELQMKLKSSELEVMESKGEITSLRERVSALVVQLRESEQRVPDGTQTKKIKKELMDKFKKVSTKLTEENEKLKMTKKKQDLEIGEIKSQLRMARKGKKTVEELYEKAKKKNSMDHGKVKAEVRLLKEKAKEADAMHDKIKAQAKKFAAERAHLMEVTRAVVKCKRLLEKKYASLQMEIDRSAMSESF